MEHAKILHIEDSEDFRARVEEILAINGVHRVVASAESLSEADKQLELIKNKQKDPNVANVILLDGRLRGSDYVNHPNYIIQKMREYGLNLPIVGLSMDGLGQRNAAVGRELAFDLTKLRVGRDKRLLDKVLDELPDPEEKL